MTATKGVKFIMWLSMVTLIFAVGSIGASSSQTTALAAMPFGVVVMLPEIVPFVGAGGGGTTASAPPSPAPPSARAVAPAAPHWHSHGQRAPPEGAGAGVATSCGCSSAGGVTFSIAGPACPAGVLGGSPSHAARTSAKVVTMRFILASSLESRRDGGGDLLCFEAA